MKNKKRLVPWLIAAVIIAALAVIGKKLYDLMFGGSLAVTTEDLKNGIIACSPAIIFIVVVLIAALIVVVAAGKLKQPKRALVRAQAPIAILLAITLSVNWVILGVEYSVVNSVFAEDVKVSDETMASGRAIADQIASEGIVLLKNDDKALPLSAGTKLNLFGWSSVRPLYGGTGSGDSDTSSAVSLIDGLKHAGFEVNEELVKFYENFRTRIQRWLLSAVPAARALMSRRASPARMNTMHSTAGSHSSMILQRRQKTSMPARVTWN